MSCGDFFPFCLLFVLVLGSETLYEGEECEIKNVLGKCINIHNCEYAQKVLKQGGRPQHCSFKGIVPIVCCPLASNNTLLNTTAENFGEKSKESCKGYNRRHHYGIAGGRPSEPREFAHMAVLGYEKENKTNWLCGGTLISRLFVLTAAHCIHSDDFGMVKKVRLGDLDIKSTTEDANPFDYGISEIFTHPNYKSPSVYNDIALLKLNQEVKFNGFVRTACLYTDYNLTSLQLIATGWGKTDFFGDTSSHLLKVNLDLIDHEKCRESYKNASDRKLNQGIIEELQVCAGGDGRDSCPGDSGGPLQFKNSGNYLIHSHYSVVGITSFGKACGVENSIGVYTRVAPYVGWIEEIVWP